MLLLPHPNVKHETTGLGNDLQLICWNMRKSNWNLDLELFLGIGIIYIIKICPIKENTNLTVSLWKWAQAQGLILSGSIERPQIEQPKRR